MPIIGLEKVIRSIEQRKKRIQKENMEIAKEIVDYGKANLQVNYAGTGITVRTFRTKNGYILQAKGDIICFLEFGTGAKVDTNSWGEGKLPISIRPGSWSVEHENTWGMWVAEGRNPDDYPYNREPQYIMYNAAKAMRDVAPRIVKVHL